MNPQRHGLERIAASVYPAVREGFLKRDDFTDALQSSFTVVGTGNNNVNGNTSIVGGRPGLLVQTVTALNDVATAAQITASALLAAGGAMSFEARVNLPVISNGIDDIRMRDGFGDSVVAADHTDGVYFEYDLTTFGDTNYRACTASNGVRTKTSMGGAPIAGSYYRLRADIAGDGSSVAFTFEQAVLLAVAIATNIPTGAVRQFGGCMTATKTLGAGAKNREVDYVEYGQPKFATRR